LIKPTVNFNTLSSTIKEMIREGKKIPDFIKVHTEQTIQVRGKADFVARNT